MKMSKLHFPSLIFTIFEGLFGFLLLVNPKSFTTMIIRFFGLIFLIIGITYLVMHLKNASNRNTVTPILSIILVILGIIFTFATGLILGLFSIVTVIYGILMIIYGAFKVQNYFEAKKVNARISFISLISAIISVILGIVVVFNPFATNMAVLKFIGISLLIEAVIDIVAIILS